MMNKFMNWMTESFAPKMNKIARNPWIASVQEAILTCMPVIFLGSIATMLGILSDFFEWFPNVAPLTDFSMGLMSMFLAFLIPYNIMDKKKHRKTKKEAGIAGLALFLMLCSPIFDADGNIVLVFWNLGSGGMLAALVAGIFAGAIMNFFARYSFFKKESSIPDFITVWFDTLIPMFLIIGTGWILVFVMQINMFETITMIFSPILSLGDSLIGWLIINFIGYCFLYTFGISTWLLYSLESAIIYPNLAINQAAVAAGGEATKIFAYGANGYMTIGGGGCTLALGIMFLLLSKSKKNKLIGKTTFLPSLCNINEPLVFGAPIAFNPILMIPMWISGLAVCLTTYYAMYFDLVSKVSVNFAFWYLPSPFGAFARGGLAGLVLLAVNFAISWIVYYPFFKIYDKQCVEEESECAEENK